MVDCRKLVFKTTVGNLVLFGINFYVILICIYPEYLVRIPAFINYYNIYRVIAFLLVVGCIYINKRGCNFFPSILISSFFIMQSFLDILHKESVDYAFVLTNIMLFLFIDVQLQKNLVQTIKSITIMLCIYIFINFITVLLFPNGLYLSSATGNASFFLGHRNSVVKFAVPQLALLIISLKLDDRKHWRIFTLIAILVNFFVAVRTWTGSGLIALSVFILVFIYISTLNSKHINIVKIFIITFLLFYVFTIYRIQEKFSFIIVDILHKDLTFTGRTQIWDIALKYISNSPFLGVGAVGYKYLGDKYMGITSAHSFYLDTLFRGGIVLMSLFTLIVIMLLLHADSIKNRIVKASILAAMSAYLCLALGEPLAGNVMLFVFIIPQVGYWIMKRGNHEI